MSKAYIYTIRDTANDSIVARGSSKECAKVINCTADSISHAAKGLMNGSVRLLKRRYLATRVADDDAILPSSKYYQVFLRKTGDLVCAGTATECATALDLPDMSSFRRIVSDSNSGAIKKWIVTAVPYRTVSPDLTRIPAVNNSADKVYARHSRQMRTGSPRSKCLYYSIYLKATDELICSGTSLECMNTLGLKNLQNFHTFLRRIRNGQSKKYELYSEPYYDDLEEEDI